jgi:hypothetical protein
VFLRIPALHDQLVTPKEENTSILKQQAEGKHESHLQYSLGPQIIPNSQKYPELDTEKNETSGDGDTQSLNRRPLLALRSTRSAIQDGSESRSRIRIRIRIRHVESCRQDGAKMIRWQGCGLKYYDAPCPSRAGERQERQR